MRENNGQINPHAYGQDKRPAALVGFLKCCFFDNDHNKQVNEKREGEKVQHVIVRQVKMEIELTLEQVQQVGAEVRTPKYSFHFGILNKIGVHQAAPRDDQEP